MNFVLVNPQHINVSNTVTTETIRSQQEEIKYDPFFSEKSCNPLLATMQNKDDVSSYIYRNCMAMLLRKTHD
jgi:hypothetical protein